MLASGAERWSFGKKHFDTADKPARPTEIISERRKKMKILVVDDSKHHQRAAHSFLKDHETKVVGNYDEGQKLVRKGHEFEAVLVDLLMPASHQKLGGSGEKFGGQEMPVGIFLALLAAKNGAKYVAVFTDSSHHDHPASACFDAFNPSEDRPDAFTVEGARMLLCNGWGFLNQNEKPMTKNWGRLLDYLTA